MTQQILRLTSQDTDEGTDMDIVSSIIGDDFDCPDVFTQMDVLRTYREDYVWKEMARQVACLQVMTSSPVISLCVTLSCGTCAKPRRLTETSLASQKPYSGHVTRTGSFIIPYE